MSIKVNRLTNANVYVNGASYLGQVEEINLPDITHIMSEHKALGMIGKFELFAGIDKMEATLKWNAFYPDALANFADPRKKLSIQVRGNLEAYGAEGLESETAVVAYMTCSPKNFPGGNLKQHDNPEATTKMTTTYYKLEIGGRVIVEIDVLANIFMVDGVDIFATYRANIGA